MIEKLFFSPRSKPKMNNFIIIFFFLLSFKSNFCNDDEICLTYYSPYLYDYEYGFLCKVIKFDHKKYQSNNFAMNKKGDLILELTEYNECNENEECDGMSSSRLFYGLTKEGKYFFSNKSSYTHEYNIEIDEEIFDPFGLNNFFEIYNSINLFVSIKNDPNKNNQYLFSINQYNSMVELHDFNNENNNYLTWNLNKFFNLDEDEYFFPYECSLFELKKESAYIIVFKPKVKVYEELRNVNFIKKFRFKSFDKNSYEEIKTVQYEQFLNHKIVDAFLMDDYNILVLVSYFESEESEQIDYNKNENSLRRLNYFNYVLNFYITNNLKALPYAKNMELDYVPPAYGYQDEEIFLKEIYLENKCALVILYNSMSELY